jgi:hypothetical protein
MMFINFSFVLALVVVEGKYQTCLKKNIHSGHNTSIRKQCLALAQKKLLHDI